MRNHSARGSRLRVNDMVQPHAEKAILGAILLNPAAADCVKDILAPEHFSEPVHGRIFARMVELAPAWPRGQLGWIEHVVNALSDIRVPARLSTLSPDDRRRRYSVTLCVEACSTITAPEYAGLIRTAATDRAAALTAEVV